MVSVKPFKSNNRDKIYLSAPNPNLKKVVIEISERQPNQWSIIWFYRMESFIQLGQNFADEILFELSWTFQPINTHRHVGKNHKCEFLDFFFEIGISENSPWIWFAWFLLNCLSRGTLEITKIIRVNFAIFENHRETPEFIQNTVFLLIQSSSQLAIQWKSCKSPLRWVFWYSISRERLLELILLMICYYFKLKITKNSRNSP